jgi:hypothetical protein
VKLPKNIDESMGNELIQPGPFFRQEPGTFSVLFGPSEIDLLVSCIEIAADNDLAFLGEKTIHCLQEVIVERHLEIESLLRALAIREIDAVDSILRILEPEHSPLRIRVLP